MNPSLSTLIEPIIPIIKAIEQAGGTSYLVGGSVRDFVLGKPLKDLDIEIHKLPIEQLESILKTFGHVINVGKQFGVLRIIHQNIDWSLPRKDSIGRKPTVAIDPSMTIQEAGRRRDLTMNAMAINLNEFIQTQSPTLIDPYDGLDDIKSNRLRAVDTTLFLDDPLRFYRVMQFIGRFDMMPDATLDTLCTTMHLNDLAFERVHEEIKKLFLLSPCPSQGFRWLLSIDRLHDTFPELQALVGVMQRQDYHPEGDVFEHSMQALDAAACFNAYNSEEEKFLIMLGALCHDLGKPAATNAQLQAHGHEAAGIKPTQKLLNRLTNNQAIIKAVLKLVQNHLIPFQFLRENVKAQSYKRMAKKLSPEVTLRQLGIIALVDNQGRNGNSRKPLDTYHDLFNQFLSNSENAMVAHGPETPVLLGRHLLDVIPEGPKLGKLLDKAYEIQIEEGVKDWEELKSRVLK